MQTLETLLNKLIELGWKPRGDMGVNNAIICKFMYKGNHRGMIQVINNEGFHWMFSINDLCSLDSGLRQFVCGLDNDYLPFCSKCFIKINSNNDKIKSEEYYEEEVNFWLMLSSIQENKEQFLLDNIQLGQN